LSLDLECRATLGAAGDGEEQAVSNIARTGTATSESGIVREVNRNVRMRFPEFLLHGF
jgi:hypothetical protein